jgi:hypothetical protein
MLDIEHFLLLSFWRGSTLQGLELADEFKHNENIFPLLHLVGYVSLSQL